MQYRPKTHQRAWSRLSKIKNDPSGSVPRWGPRPLPRLGSSLGTKAAGHVWVPLTEAACGVGHAPYSGARPPVKRTHAAQRRCECLYGPRPLLRTHITPCAGAMRGSVCCAAIGCRQGKATTRPKIHWLAVMLMIQTLAFVPTCG